MKAVLCKEYGPPEKLSVEEVPDLTPGKGQVVVAVKACGVNFPDTLIIQGKYQFKPPLPFSPGGEVAGVIKSVGEEVTNVKPGDRVIAFTTWGGYAEEVIIEASQLIPMSPDLDFATASAFVLTYGTSIHALKDRAQLKAGETLLVLGAAGGLVFPLSKSVKSWGRELSPPLPARRNWTFAANTARTTLSITPPKTSKSGLKN